MTAWTYLTRSNIVTARPCQLLSVLVTTDGSGPGKVELYDEKGAVEGCKVATLLCPAMDSKHFLFHGPELQRGLFVDFVEKADYVTVEWDPLLPATPPATPPSTVAE